MNTTLNNEKLFTLKTTNGYNAVLIIDGESVDLIVHSGWSDLCTKDIYWRLDSSGRAQLGCSLYSPMDNVLVDCFIVVLDHDAKAALQVAMPCDIKEDVLPDNVIPLFGGR